MKIELFASFNDGNVEINARIGGHFETRLFFTKMKPGETERLAATRAMELLFSEAFDASMRLNAATGEYGEQP